MGSNLDILVNIESPTSPMLQTAADHRVANSVFSRPGHRGLSPVLEKSEEDDVNSGDERETLLGYKKTIMKSFPFGTFGSPKFNEGHCDMPPHRFPSYGTLGKASMLGETSGSKEVGNVLLSDRLDILELGNSRDVRAARLCVGFLKMDIPLVVPLWIFCCH